MPKKRNKTIAKEITDYLFTSGTGEKAGRLVLESNDSNKRDLGGWGYTSVLNLIYKNLEANTPILPKKGSKL